VARREQDVVFRALDAHGLRARLAGIGGTVRVVGQADERGLTDVFWRPAKGIPDPRSLLRTLHRRIGAIALSAPAEAISPAAAPPPRAQRRSP
jgi:hypothetical protein